jgi:hypothetical protein
MVKGRLDGKATTATGYAWSSGKRMWRGRRALCGFYRVGSSLSSQATMTCPDSWADLEQAQVSQC